MQIVAIVFAASVSTNSSSSIETDPIPVESSLVFLKFEEALCAPKTPTILDIGRRNTIASSLNEEYFRFAFQCQTLLISRAIVIITGVFPRRWNGRGNNATLEREEGANAANLQLLHNQLGLPLAAAQHYNCRFSVEFMNPLGNVAEIYFCYWNPAVIRK